MSNLTLRKNKNSKLSIEELDNNFIYLDGKSNSLLPNGVEIIETSRTYSKSDAGKLLMIGSASLTMPSNNPFDEGDIISISCQYNTSSFNTEFGGELCYMLPTGDGSMSENILLQNTLLDGSLMLISLSGGIKYNENEPYGAYVQINLSESNPQNFTAGMFKVYIEYKEPLFI